MKKSMLAGFIAVAFSTAIFAIPVEASERDGSFQKTHNTKTHHTKTHARAKSHKRTHARADAHANVVAMITSMAPSYGVPTWFALRIAKVESGYNPNARGSHGEFGVFQMKCATARGIGYNGKCSGLLDARTNVKYGLKHLSLAIKSSGGNLKLAASKHNGGLGRKHLVKSYVAMVF